MSEELEGAAPGWDAIDRAVKPLYPGQTPLHWGTILSHSLGGRDPLDGISAYRAEPSHWHFVTYGMSELYAKGSDLPDQSGWGFEFTFRLARHGEDEPAPWVLSFLNNLARYVFESRNPFEAGHHVNLNSPIALGAETLIRAVSFVEDPQLGTIDTPHGRLRFLQIVGLTLDELDAMREWNTAGVLDLLRAADPLLVTDLARRSWLEDAAIRAAVSEGARREGSSQDMCFVSRLDWTLGVEAQVTMGGIGARELLRMLPHRLPFGRHFALVGRSKGLRLEPGPFAWRAEDDVFVISLPADACAAFLAGFAVRRGAYRWPALPGLEVVVVPSEIKDHEGKVAEVIG